MNEGEVIIVDRIAIRQGHRPASNQSRLGALIIQKWGGKWGVFRVTADGDSLISWHDTEPQAEAAARRVFEPEPQRANWYGCD